MLYSMNISESIMHKTHTHTHKLYISKDISFRTKHVLQIKE